MTGPTRDMYVTSTSMCGGIDNENHASLSLRLFGFGRFIFTLICFFRQCRHVMSFDPTTLCRPNCRQGQGGDSTQSKRLERPAGDKRFGAIART